MENENVKVVLAAGGNPTGIIFADDGRNRKEYAAVAKEYMGRHPEIEQFGFVEGVSHFQMSGGEFCGNAARAAALLISQKTGSNTGSFTMSGFNGVVNYRILEPDKVECVFDGLQISSKTVEFGGIRAALVDLGGIIHLVLPTSVTFKNDKLCYTAFHKKAMVELGLCDRAAVGVVWQDALANDSVAIHPVVWVRDIDSFFYETACGSGTLAVLEASNASVKDVVQPSGQSIHSERLGATSYLLMSTVSVLNE